MFSKFVVNGQMAWNYFQGKNNVDFCCLTK